MIRVFFKKLKEKAIIPSFGDNDTLNAAVDLYYCGNSIIIWPFTSRIMETGITWFVDPNQAELKNNKIAMIIQSRSGMAFYRGLESSNAGVIDQGYQGEIKVKLYNFSFIPRRIVSGERIAQGIIEVLPKILKEEWQMDKSLPTTLRGNKGFGSTGK